MLGRHLRRALGYLRHDREHRAALALQQASTICVETLEQRTLLTAVFNSVFGAETQKQDDGDVMRRPPINIIFWGPYWQGGNSSDESQWNSNNTSDAQNIIDATNTLIKSTYLNVTTQYGADPANMFVNDTAWDSSIPPTGFDTGKLDDIVQNKIENGPFPEPDNQQGLQGEHELPIYLVVTQPGIKSSEPNAAGYNIVPLDFYFPHLERTPEIWVSTRIDTTVPNNHVDVSTFTKYLSHEIAEIMTDYNNGGYKVNTPTLWEGGGDDQIGDKEGNAYSFRMSDSSGNPSTLVQPLWSKDDQAWVVTDGTAQTFNLQPLGWNTTTPDNPSFSGKYDLTINGDQWLNINDQITLGGTSGGGVFVNLNGEIVNFDPNYLSSITLNLKSGLNSVHFASSLPQNVRLDMNAASPLGGSILLQGPDNSFNSWQITGADRGTFANTISTGNFSDVESITGGNASDSFTFLPGGSLSGGIDGGGHSAGGVDILDFSHFLDATHPDPVEVDLQARTATPLAHQFVNIGAIVGTTASDTLTGSGHFSITSPNAGKADGIQFSSFENLIGGSADDSFDFQIGGTILGLIDGGLGNNSFNYSALSTPVFVSLGANLATSVASFNHISNFVGNHNVSNLIGGPVASSVWNLTGRDSGTVAGVSYSSFLTLNGNIGDDRFVFQPGAVVSGLLAGGPGVNTLDYSALPGPVSVNFTTQVASNISFEFLGITNVIGSQSTNDTIVGPDAEWVINGTNTGSVNEINFSSFENVTGGPLTDTYTFMDGGNITGNLDGGAGINTLDYSHLTSPVTLNFADNTATGIGGTFANVGGFVGGQGQNNVVGPASDTTWTITGVNTVNVLGTTFTNFSSITGGPANDTFVLLTEGRLDGKIDGGGGDNTLSYAQFAGNVIADLTLHFATRIGQGVFNLGNLTGGIGDSLLVGDAGENTLLGGTGRNVIIGESGADLLAGGGGDNILIGDSSVWDTNLNALSAIFAEWTRLDLSFEQRVSHLLGSSADGLNGSFSLDKKAIVADTSDDILVGKAGLDWFFETKKIDSITGGRTAGDHVTDL